jgi:ABC-2 type transport system permease protein
MPMMPFADIAPQDVTWSLFVAFTVLGGLAFTSLGFVMAWMSPSSSAFHALMSIFLIPMWILSGAMFPLENTWMASIAAFNPASWLVQGFHYSLLGARLGLDLSQVFSHVFISGFKLILFCIFAMGVGVYACTRNR